MKCKDFYWLNDESKTFLSRGYLPENQTAQQRIKIISDKAQEILNLKGFSDKFFSYMAKGFFSLSTPIWTNFGTSHSLPISCYGSYIQDSVDSILEKLIEVGKMSKLGGGTSAYFGDVRPRGAKISIGGKSDGPVRFMEMFDKVSDIISQGAARRGSFAAYLPIEHGDIKEFLAIRSDGHPIQSMSIGITVTDKWMQEMIDGDEKKREIWAKVLEKKFATGYPYIMFTDTVNNNAPEVYKSNGKKIYASNLCSEILLSTSEDESFVCDLSSMNLLHYEEWKDTDAVETLTYFLDAVMTEFIDKTKDSKFMQTARNFAVRQRALGVGVLGWHSFLQSKMIPFESMEAKLLNSQIFKFIQEKTLKASQEMAKIYGEPELLKGIGRRNVTLTSIAPTTSSSFILGQVSKAIEPLDSNYFVQKLAKGNFTYKNPYLKNLLKLKDKDTDEIWKSILDLGGSVQRLSFLSQSEKDVFKTFGEISQKEIVIQAAQRQKFIDQSQSLNFKIHPSTPVKEVNSLIIDSWKLGIKTLYYQRSMNPAQELSRSILECKSCEA